MTSIDQFDNFIALELQKLFSDDFQKKISALLTGKTFYYGGEAFIVLGIEEALVSTSGEDPQSFQVTLKASVVNFETKEEKFYIFAGEQSFMSNSIDPIALLDDDDDDDDDEDVDFFDATLINPTKDQ